MKINHLLLFLILCSIASCKKTSQTVVLAGDSWGFYVCLEKSLQSALESAGFKDARVSDTCLVTTTPGRLAAEWLQTDNHKATVAALLDESVKVLYLSLGGNDSMVKWNRHQNQKEMNTIATEIRDDIANVVNVYRTLRPDIKIIVSGYDYPRFQPNHPIKIYQDMYKSMGEPEPYEINNMLIQFSAKVSEVADGQSVFYAHHIGLMQYYFGNEAAGLKPYTTAPPELIGSMTEPTRFGGNPLYTSDATVMRNLEGTLVDPFHLTSFGYDRIAEHAVSLYIRHWLTK